jgi:hypothetical protein
MGLYQLGMKSTFHSQTIWGQVFDMTLYNIVAIRQYCFIVQLKTLHLYCICFIPVLL